MSEIASTRGTAVTLPAAPLGPRAPGADSPGLGGDAPAPAGVGGEA